jgi:hypothetical protein
MRSLKLRSFEHQVIDASPERFLTPDGWKKASSGLIGQKVFSVVSLCVTWDRYPSPGRMP